MRPSPCLKKPSGWTQHSATAGWGAACATFAAAKSNPGARICWVAAALEPQRALLRSYLGKAFSLEGEWLLGRRELDLAKRLDPRDPTAWLYLALLDQQENRVNEGVRDLEKSKDLNDQRSLFRSRLLLDQDRAVRSANLAALYRDAGLEQFSLGEAGRAVAFDYGNYPRTFSWLTASMNSAIRRGSISGMKHPG